MRFFLILLTFIFSFTKLLWADQSNLSSHNSKIGFMFAMPEEAKAIDDLAIKLHWKDYLGYKIAEFNYGEHHCIAMITGVGKSLSAGGAALMLSKYNPDVIVNIGSAGGINCDVGDVIISQEALFHDVNLGSIKLPLYKLPDLPIVIKSKNDLIKSWNLEQKFSSIAHCKRGLIISSDQFLHRAAYYKDLIKRLPNAKATEMEAASIAGICHRAGKDFLFIKKISNRADDNKDEKFGEEILHFKDKIGKIVLAILN